MGNSGKDAFLLSEPLNDCFTFHFLKFGNPIKERTVTVC